MSGQVGELRSSHLSGVAARSWGSFLACLASRGGGLQEPRRSLCGELGRMQAEPAGSGLPKGRWGGIDGPVTPGCVLGGRGGFPARSASRWGCSWGPPCRLPVPVLQPRRPRGRGRPGRCGGIDGPFPTVACPGGRGAFLRARRRKSIGPGSSSPPSCPRPTSWVRPLYIAESITESFGVREPVWDVESIAESVGDQPLWFAAAVAVPTCSPSPRPDRTASASLSGSPSP